MVIHEYGDEFLRPTNKAWKCSKCGTELYLVSSILSHKKRCTNDDSIKIQVEKSSYDLEREQKLRESLEQFKKQNKIGVN